MDKPKSSMVLMPVWTSDGDLDPMWLQDRLQDPSITHASIEDISNATRKGDKPKDGATLKITVTRHHRDDGDVDDGEAVSRDDSGLPDTIVLKQTLNTTKGIGMSKSLGLTREALFYEHLHSMSKLTDTGDVNVSIPTIYHAHGNWETGEKVILMADLSSSHVDSGIFFGPGNPNNWKRDLPTMIAKAYDGSRPPSAAKVAHITFKAIAKVHAKFWKDKTLMDKSWLRGSNWIQGEGKSSWEASQNFIKGIYEAGIDDKLESWDPLVKAILKRAMSGISWTAQLERLNAVNSNWTLVHGDFWPGNVLISTDITADKDGTDDSVKVLDWEMVGLGSGPQDLGQYILSNMAIEERRNCEEEIVKAYWKELTDNGVDSDSFTWDECWREYRIGGVERFLWFLVYFCGQPDGSPLLKWGQFFHDQIADFVKDHDLQPADFVQPRP